MSNRVVVLDEAGGIAEQVRRALSPERWTVGRAASEQEAHDGLGRGAALLVVNPCLHPTMDFGHVERLVGAAGDVPVAFLVGCAPVEAACRVLFPQVTEVLRYPLETAALRQRLLAAANGNGHAGRTGVRISGLGALIGGAAAMQEVYALLQQAARSEATVLITGETGTGKDLVARTIHELSPRRRGPFVVVSCAELSDSLLESEIFGHVRGSFTGAARDKMGLFEAAHGGTVYMDEVADGSPTLQARLLRVAEEHRVRRVGSVRPRSLDIRLVAASQVDLEQRVRAGSFREDLYYRLKVLTIPLPPLRERMDDLPALVADYFRRTTPQGDAPMVCSPLALEALRNHHWPGNLRELFATLESAAARCAGRVITPADLPRRVARAGRDGAARERRIILHALEAAGGHRKDAATRLGISRTTLWRRMKELDLPG